MKSRVLILGAGVSGLTTGYTLSRQGYDVAVLADKDASQTPSVVAGALWEFPPAVCGHHNDKNSLERSKVWSVFSYQRFNELANDPDTGVTVTRSNFYFHNRVEESKKELGKMLELRPHVKGFDHRAELVSENGINPELGLSDAYSYLAPIIDTDVYMEWLRQQLLQDGCQYVRRRLHDDLRAIEGDLLSEFDASAIVNCTGLGSRELASDDLFPLRGALVRLVNNGVSMPRMNEAHCITHDSSKPEQNMIYVIPRGKDRLLLGGIAQPDEWDTDIDLDNSSEVRSVLDRCRRFMPRLQQGTLDSTKPVIVGLRPSRKRNVRLERQPGHRIFHNYGHGGSGFSLSWGCAAEIADLVGAATSQPNSQDDLSRNSAS